MNGSTFTGFRYHADELQKSTVSSATSAGILSGEEPPPYHEVVRQRKDYRWVIFISNFSLLIPKKAADIWWKRVQRAAHSPGALYAINFRNCNLPCSANRKWSLPRRILREHGDMSHQIQSTRPLPQAGWICALVRSLAPQPFQPLPQACA